MTKEELLKQVWECYTFDEIIDAGFEYNKCSGEQIINAAAEFESCENDENTKTAIEKIEEICDNDAPSSSEIANFIDSYYDLDDILWHFDNDKLIDYLDGSYEIQRYVEENSVNEEIDTYTFNDFKTEVEELPNWKFKRFLCDLLMLQYTVSNEELLRKLNDKI
jgi:hypothetical protein